MMSATPDMSFAPQRAQPKVIGFVTGTLQSRVIARAGISLLFGVLSLNTLIWFHAGKPIGYGDTGVFAFYWNPSFLFHAFHWTWNPYELGGEPAPSNLTLLPTATFFLILRTVGLPVAITEALWFSLIEFLTLSFAYLFFRRVMGSLTHASRIACCAALVYVFNPIDMIVYWYPGDLSVVVILLLPMLLYSVTIAIDKGTIRGMLLVALSLVLCASAFTNAAFALPALGVVTLFAVYWPLRLPGSVRTKIKAVLRSAVAGVGGCLINMWWLLPLIQGAGGFYNEALRLESGSQALQQSSSFTSAR